MQPVNRKWYGDKLWYLLNLEPNELREIFSDKAWDNLKNKRKIYRKKIKSGIEPYPPRPEEYQLGDRPETIIARLDAAPDLDHNELGERLVNQQEEAALLQ